jgi:peptidoglycan-N-acetylglucosamine deacetylase
MYFVKTPPLIKTLFSDYHWNIPSEPDTIYLSFDDGPVPEVTPWVLDLLKKYGFKATFFCVGENVIRHKDIFNRIIDEGHAVGNHTFNHLNGWRTDTESYMDNVSKCNIFTESTLFRPPYGKLTPRQAQIIKQNYTIVMWDVLSGDFDPTVSAERCVQNVLNNYEQGSVIVFHDSIKAWDKLRIVLPVVLEYFSKKGFRSDSLYTLTSKNNMYLPV